MTVQIRTTHVGSLPRTDDLLKANAAHAEGRLDDAGLAAVVRAQTDAVVARQTDIGLSIVNDGEYGHAMTEKVDYGAWWLELIVLRHNSYFSLVRLTPLISYKCLNVLIFKKLW